MRQRRRWKSAAPVRKLTSDHDVFLCFRTKKREDHSRLGVATKLLDFAIIIAKSKGMKNMFLHVEKLNKSALLKGIQDVAESSTAESEQPGMENNIEADHPQIHHPDLPMDTTFKKKLDDNVLNKCALKLITHRSIIQIFPWILLSGRSLMTMFLTSAPCMFQLPLSMIMHCLHFVMQL